MCTAAADCIHRTIENHLQQMQAGKPSRLRYSLPPSCRNSARSIAFDCRRWQGIRDLGSCGALLVEGVPRVVSRAEVRSRARGDRDWGGAVYDARRKQAGGIDGPWEGAYYCAGLAGRSSLFRCSKGAAVCYLG